MFAYFDTSAMLRSYVTEGGGTQAAQLRLGYRCASSALLPVELLGALYRKAQGGEIGRTAYREAQRRISDDRQYWDLGPVSPEVLEQAERIVTTLLVRAADAIHIATARNMSLGYGSAMAFITADRRQAEAAAKLGLEVLFVGGD